MNPLPRSLFVFALAGSVAGSAAHAADDDPASTARPRHFADYHITSVNREPMHAPIYGTFHDEASAEAYRKTPSQYTLDLNGTWKFQLFGRPDEAPDDFIRPDFSDSSWFDMAVPSNWQNDMRIPDRGIYVNDILTFQKIADPPLPPEANPTGCYRRTFDVPEDWLERDVRIVFDAVDSAYDFWINGAYGGYAEDSRLPSEFAVTKLLKPGKNTIAVKVYRYSNGSYLECQDVWRMSGIYRGVRLMALSPVHLRDWSVKTTFTDPAKNQAHGKSDANLDIRAYVETRALPRQPVANIPVSTYPGVQVKARLVDAEGKLVAESDPARFSGQAGMYGRQGEKGLATISMRIAAPEQWSPDSPYLYKLFLHLLDDSGKTLEVQYVPVGFRQIEIRDRTVFLNGQRLIVRGVNRHDFNPKHAFAVTEDDMRRDIEAMKKLNFNAVRTCHYPNNNLWYDLCDEYGLLVVDETNIETHGIGALLSRDPEWAPIYLERAERMVLRDRNHPCIGFWSLGNESGAGANHAAMAGWIRYMDPTRPVQYESGNPGPAISDIACPMYPRVATIRSILNNPSEKRPFIMCEYAYAKGNSTGNIFKYWDLVHENREFQGGFVWDWADKALLNVIAKTGEVDYGYGNDFGENFDYPGNRQNRTQILNGIVDASLKPHPGAQEVRVCQSPIRFKLDMDHGATDTPRPIGQFVPNKLTIINERNNASTAGLKFRWEETRNGDVIKSGVLDVPVIECFESAVVDVPVATPEPTGVYYLNVYCDAPTHEITRQQFELRSPVVSGSRTIFTRRPMQSADMTIAESDVKETGDTLVIGFLTWSKATGELVSMKPEGRELLASPVEEIFYRAPTCNDRMMDADGSYAKDWPPLFDGKRENVRFGWKKTDNGRYEVTVSARVGGVIDSQVVWTVDPAKAQFLNFRQSASFRGEDIRSIARVGMMFPLAEGFETAKYFGRGPYENYPDRFVASLVGRWENNIADMLENYLVPSECGSRGDVRELDLTGENGLHLGAFENGGKPFRFSALHVSPRDLMAADHSWELKQDTKTWLILDGFQMGVGGDDGWSLSVHDEYLLRPGRYDWGCTLDFRKPE